MLNVAECATLYLAECGMMIVAVRKIASTQSLVSSKKPNSEHMTHIRLQELFLCIPKCRI